MILKSNEAGNNSFKQIQLIHSYNVYGLQFTKNDIYYERFK